MYIRSLWRDIPTGENYEKTLRSVEEIRSVCSRISTSACARVTMYRLPLSCARVVHVAFSRRTTRLFSPPACRFPLSHRHGFAKTPFVAVAVRSTNVRRTRSMDYAGTVPVSSFKRSGMLRPYYGFFFSLSDSFVVARVRVRYVPSTIQT